MEWMGTGISPRMSCYKTIGKSFLENKEVMEDFHENIRNSHGKFTCLDTEIAHA
jgi:hypothetical protein